MTETKFKPGETYKTRKGEPMRIKRIDDREEVFPVIAVDALGFDHCHRADGKYFNGDVDSDNDLLLPAIEAEGAPAPEMHPRVREALVAMRELWESFAKDVRILWVNPGDGGLYAYKSGSGIVRNYPSYPAALAEASAVIAAINSLLEGRDAE